MYYHLRKADLWWNQLLGVTRGIWERAAEGVCQMVGGADPWRWHSQNSLGRTNCNHCGKPCGVAMEALKEVAGLEVHWMGHTKYFLGDDGLRFLVYLFKNMKLRECVYFDIFGTWTIGDGKTEYGEKDCLLSLAWIKSLGISQILEIIVVRENNECMLCTLQPMPPLL